MNQRTTVTQADIDEILARATVRGARMGEKSCVVHVTLANGFEITETAACVDPANYNQEMGEKIALGRIKDRLWLLEGWRLACALHGAP